MKYRFMKKGKSMDKVIKTNNEKHSIIKIMDRYMSIHYFLCKFCHKNEN